MMETVSSLHRKRVLMLIDVAPYVAAAAAVVHYLSSSSFSSLLPDGFTLGQA